MQWRPSFRLLLYTVHREVKFNNHQRKALAVAKHQPKNNDHFCIFPPDSAADATPSMRKRTLHQNLQKYTVGYSMVSSKSGQIKVNSIRIKCINEQFISRFISHRMIRKLVVRRKNGTALILVSKDCLVCLLCFHCIYCTLGQNFDLSRIRIFMRV